MRKVLFFVTLSSFILYISCEKNNGMMDVNTDVNKQLKVSKISKKEFDLNVPANSYFEEAESILKNKQKTKNLHDTINHFWIITDSITYIKRGQYHSYTFDIILDNPNPFQKNTLLLSTNPDSTYLSLIITYQYDNNYNLINYYYEDVIDSNIFETNRTEDPICWCCDLSDDMLRIVYGCEATEGTSSDSDSSDTSTDTYDDYNENLTTDDDDVLSGGGEVIVDENIEVDTNTEDGSIDDPIHLTTVPDITIIDEIVYILNNLTEETLIWLYNSENYQIVQELYDYLQVNNFSQQAQEFVNLIASNQINDLSNINFDDCIIYQGWANYNFFKDIIIDIVNIDNSVINEMRDIFDQDYETMLSFSVANHGEFPNTLIAANTSPLFASPSDSDIIIVFNPDRMDIATDLFFAVVTVHEIIHAILINAVIKGQFTNLTTLDDYPILLNAFIDYATNHADTGFGTTSHEIMTNLIDKIAIVIEKYGIQEGYHLTSEYYKKLAWIGLINTIHFNSLQYDEQQDIINTIFAEQNNMSFIENGIQYNPQGTRP